MTCNDGSTTPDPWDLILGPVSFEEFQRNYWEKRPVHVARRESGRFEHLFSTYDADEMLATHDLRLPTFRLVRDTQPIPQTEYVRVRRFSAGAFLPDVADISQVARLYNAGSTLVFQHLEAHRSCLRRVSTALTARFGSPVEIHAFVAPPNTGLDALGAHYDALDIFVLQVEGRKTWKLREPEIALPLDTQRDRGERLGSEPIGEYVLSPGDTLYMPRGTIHEVVKSHGASLHLSIAVRVQTVFHALKALVEEALRQLESEVELRRSLPLGTLSGAALAGEARTRKTVDRACQLLAAQLGRIDAMRLLRRRFAAGAAASLGGRLATLKRIGDVQPETWVQRRGDLVAHVDEGRAGIALTFSGNTIPLPAYASPLVQQLEASEQPLKVQDFKGDMTGHERVLLAQALLIEGYLEIVETPPQAKND